MTNFPLTKSSLPEAQSAILELGKQYSTTLASSSQLSRSRPRCDDFMPRDQIEKAKSDREVRFQQIKKIAQQIKETGKQLANRSPPKPIKLVNLPIRTAVQKYKPRRIKLPTYSPDKENTNRQVNIRVASSGPDSGAEGDRKSQVKFNLTPSIHMSNTPSNRFRKV